MFLAQQSSGLLPTRASFMLDFVFLAMFAILPLLGLSLYLVRFRRRYQWHKRMQLALALVLFLAVLAFEIDMRFFTDWEALAAPSPYYAPGTWNPVWYSLTIHLGFAIPTLILWVYVIGRAWKGFPVPAAPSAHSRAHIFWARLAALGMALTAVTGWIFYWLAFVS
jgi:uncharacterized membrane protein YozB (DUF420 family)